MLSKELDFSRLRAFQLVASNGSLRVAANRLSLTIPAISAKIRRLERDLGVDFFQRLPNKLILTSAGQRFLREVDALFAQAEQMFDGLTADQESGRLSVSVGSDHSWYFAPRVTSYLKKHPQIELSLQVYRAADAITALQRGEIDVAIGIFPKLPPGLEKETIVETSMALVVPKGHRLSKFRPPKLREIASHRLILLPRHAETRKIIDKPFADEKLETGSIIEVANCGTAATFVEEGVGIAIVHSLCVRHQSSRSLDWIDLGKHFGKIDFSVVYRKGALRSHVLRGLLDELGNLK
jgi:DNA-binding transcriptional LysR family regulator